MHIRLAYRECFENRVGPASNPDSFVEKSRFTQNPDHSRIPDTATSIPDSKYFVYGKNAAQPPARMNHLQATLQISEASDGSVFLLNFNALHQTEWEAWHFANYLPGAERYRSFAELFLAFVKMECDAQ